MNTNGKGETVIPDNWETVLHERCLKPNYTEISAAWCQGYACGLKDAGLLTTDQLVRFIEYVRAHKTTNT